MTMSDIVVRHHHGDRLTVAVCVHEVVVDQPEADGGEDVGPTPTELFVSGLAACVGFYAERYLRRHDLDPTELVVVCDYDLGKNRPARVSEIRIAVTAPGLPEAVTEPLARGDRALHGSQLVGSAPDREDRPGGVGEGRLSRGVREGRLSRRVRFILPATGAVHRRRWTHRAPTWSTSWVYLVRRTMWRMTPVSSTTSTSSCPALWTHAGMSTLAVSSFEMTPQTSPT